jgi:hypothetical protein
MRRVIGRVRYEAKSIVAMYPSIAVPLARRRGRGHGKVFDHSTDLVVEGFPRSANQFALAALRQAEDRELRIANRVHAPGHVIAATKAQLPVLLLIREPEPAVLGWVLYRGTISVGQALRAYRRFYAPLVPYRDQVVVATFDQATTDFGEVIRRLNERFGTDFAEFQHTEENVRRIFQAMEWYTGAHWPPDQMERMVGRPSSDREEAKARLRAIYNAPRLRGARAKAQRLYALFAS